MSDASPIQPILPGVTADATPKTSAARGSDTVSFSDVLENSIQEVNALQKEADSAVQSLVQGKTESVTEVFSAVEKADLAFRTLMSVRNKLLEAYEEIWRLRV